MKTSVLKMVALPFAAFVLASAGAVTSKAIALGGNPPIVGYVHGTSDTDCLSREVNCNPVSGDICMSSDNLRVWRYDEFGGTACNQNLYKD